jgi:hypothetical protein
MNIRIEQYGNDIIEAQMVFLNQTTVNLFLDKELFAQVTAKGNKSKYKWVILRSPLLQGNIIKLEWYVLNTIQPYHWVQIDEIMHKHTRIVPSHLISPSSESTRFLIAGTQRVVSIVQENHQTILTVE